MSIKQQLINYGKHLPKAFLANLKYGFPGKKLKVIGVTGTDGKTTTVNMIYKILKDNGRKVSMVSTINASVGGKVYDTGFHVTSPPPEDVQKYLSLALKNKDEYFVLEVTSHALDQFRVWGVPFEVVVITNVTHEHLDYHGTFKKYLQAKAMILKSAKMAVLNKDDENFKYLKKQVRGDIVTFGKSLEADYCLDDFDYKLAIPGEYNLLNALAATAVANQLGLSEKEIKKALERFNTLSGRMEEVKNSKGIQIMVDFAHTPNALQNALITLKKETQGKLISVFGCASERDVKKRPLMGQISAKIADITILTSEDPRFEDPDKIMDEIQRGAAAIGAKLNKDLFREADRLKAIKLALGMAKRGDVVGIFGKGHERSMNIKGKEIPWSDTDKVKTALKANDS